MVAPGDPREVLGPVGLPAGKRVLLGMHAGSPGALTPAAMPSTAQHSGQGLGAVPNITQVRTG